MNLLAAPGARERNQTNYSIEQGYFVLTLMPSLYCDLDCPHCYLSTTERRDPTRLSDENLRRVLENIDEFYTEQRIGHKTIQAYHYGGEPTSMGLSAFTEMLDSIEEVLSNERGYEVRHTILTSLVEVDLDEWEPLFRERCGGFLQTSFDGRMRGGKYMRQWDAKMADAKQRGLTLSTISVVNERILQEGPKETLAYLSELGVVESSFLPFMWNAQNDGLKYDRLAPTMDRWSDFMIEISEEWLRLKTLGQHVPEIGQLRFIESQSRTDDPVSNVAGQTLFLMPNGDFALPDYTKGWQEYMNRFANGIRKPFREVLASPKRRAYMRKQLLKNSNSDCLDCQHADKCVMEFWKDNKPDDDCFGGKKYVEWVLANLDNIRKAEGNVRKTVALY